MTPRLSTAADTDPDALSAHTADVSADAAAAADANSPARALGTAAAEHAATRERACFFLQPTSGVRRAAWRISSAPAFKLLVLAAILANVVTIALGDALAWRSVAELVFAVLFAVEAAIKMLALGVLAHRGSYFRDGCAIYLAVHRTYITHRAELQSART